MPFSAYLVTLTSKPKTEGATCSKNKFAKVWKKAIRSLLLLIIGTTGACHAGAQCGSAALSFRAATSFEVAGTPESITIGDFNRDGKLDVATANSITDDISIVSGTGTGSFSAALNISVPDLIPTSITSGDFNGDGKVDLAIASSRSYFGTLLLNDDYGTFRLANYFEVGALPEAITPGDFNGDGHLDLATATLGSNTVSVLLGNGAGIFSAAIQFSVGTFPASIAAGDFNGDGNLDLVTANEGSNDLSVLLGNGAGGFAKSTSVGLSFFAQSITAGDFNGDGKLDLATASSLTGDFSVILGNGTGSFGTATHFKVDGVGAISSGDFNKDGKLDVAAGYTTGGKNRVMVLLNTCGQSLQGKPNLPPNDSPDSKKKVLVCHNGKTLQIAQSALSAHLKHGDNLGPCTSATTFLKAHAGAPLIAVYPNPSSGQFSITLQGTVGGRTEVLILDAKGVAIEQRHVVLISKNQTLHVNLKGRIAGVYLIKIKSAAGVQTQKVVVHR